MIHGRPSFLLLHISSLNAKVPKTLADRDQLRAYSQIPCFKHLLIAHGVKIDTPYEFTVIEEQVLDSKELQRRLSFYLEKITF